MNRPGKPFDIRVYKRGLREHYKSLREAAEPGERAGQDIKILQNIISMQQFTQCETLLCYVSTRQEADTRALINRAIADGKKVAVPYCVDGTRKMDFYLIGGIGELKPRSFGVLEPLPEKARKLTDFRNSVCILPGLAFDRYGYRLGYGGGYYDRFLSKVYRGVTIGICYERCRREKLLHGRFDVPCDYIVTENRIIKAESPPNRGSLPATEATFISISSSSKESK